MQVYERAGPQVPPTTLFCNALGMVRRGRPRGGKGHGKGKGKGDFHGKGKGGGKGPLAEVVRHVAAAAAAAALQALR